MAINRNDRTVVASNFGIAARVNSQTVARERSVPLGAALGFARTAVMVALASLAILVLLPAAIAAQAAAAI